MKIFLKWFYTPLLVATIASLLYLIDALIGRLFVPNGTFLWISFAVWTIFYNSDLKDRIKGLIGIVVGFFAALFMMAITNSFTMNIFTISISSLIGIFFVNFLVVYLDKTNKIWPSSIKGIFTSITLTFSGLGINLAPTSNIKNTFLMFIIIIIYSIFGLVFGHLSTIAMNKAKSNYDKLETK